VLIGVENGRMVFENLKKVVLYLLPGGTFAEMLTIVVNVLLGTPAPLGAFLMIYISCVTDIAPALSLVLEKPERDLMNRPPRDVKKDRIVNLRLIVQAYLFLGLLITLGCFVNWFYYWYAYVGLGFSDLFLQYDNFGTEDQLTRLVANGNLPGPDLTSALNQLNDRVNVASSVYFVSIVYLQMFGNLLSTRTRRLSILQHNPLWGPSRNLSIPIAMCLSTLFVLFILYVPLWQDIFLTRPVPVECWFIAISFGIAIMLLDEGRRLIVRRFPDSFVAKVAW